jgi:hypothetical protein
MGLCLMNMLGLSSSVRIEHIACYWKFLLLNYTQVLCQFRLCKADHAYLTYLTKHRFPQLLRCYVRVCSGDHVIATESLPSNGCICWLHNSALSIYATILFHQVRFRVSRWRILSGYRHPNSAGLRFSWLVIISTCSVYRYFSSHYLHF